MRAAMLKREWTGARLCDIASTFRSGPVDARVSHVAFYLRANCDKRMCVCDVSRWVNLSDSHLAQLFRQEAGVSLQRFLKNVRLGGSWELLETTYRSVKEVMAQVGVTDTWRFVRRV